MEISPEDMAPAIIQNILEKIYEFNCIFNENIIDKDTLKDLSLNYF
jgi:hypothetical protein